MARFLGVPQRTIAAWVAKGLIPARESPRGRGKRMALTIEDALTAWTILELKLMGLSLQKVRRVIEYLRSVGLELSDVWLLEVAGDEVIAYRSRREAFAVLKRPGQRIILPLREARRRMEKHARREEALNREVGAYG